MSKDIMHSFQDILMPKGIDDKGRKIWSFREGYNRDKLSFGIFDLDSPEDIAGFFDDEGFEISPARPIVNPNGTTLFVSAGVQILEDVLHHDIRLEDGVKKFVAQPVFRTQFLGMANEFSSSSFINITTVIVEATYEEHVKTLSSWFRLMSQLGMDLQRVMLITENREGKWGSKKFDSQVIRIRYRNLSVGDATLITSFLTEQGEVVVSDIGFGLERLRMLATGEPYWNFIENLNSLDDVNINIMDLWNTLTLLACSGLTPSNNDRGYRFRKICKSLVEVIGFRNDTDFLFDIFFSRWKKWIELPVSRNNAWELINKEMSRNLNAAIKSKLENIGYTTVGMDINLPTDKYLRLMKGAAVKMGDLESVLAELGYKF